MRDRRATVEEELGCNQFCIIEHCMILAIIRRRPICRPDADDLAQDVWRNVLDSLAKLRFDSARDTLESWIARTAKSVARSHARRHANHRQETLTGILAAGILGPDAEPSAVFGQKELQEEMRAIVDELRRSLPDRDRRILFMRYVRDMPLADIAAELDLTEDCVRGAIRRISPKLLVLLRRAGLGPGAKKTKRKSGISDRCVESGVLI